MQALRIVPALGVLAFLGCSEGIYGPPLTSADTFMLRIESLEPGGFASAFASGVWVVHSDADPFFTEGAPDRGEGLEALAEDGDPTALAARLDRLRSGVFMELAPGAAYEVRIPAEPSSPFLSLASMLAESNDVFLAPSGEGIPLFDAQGHPLPERDVTDLLFLWNAGTEIDQAPGQGLLQAPRQGAPGSGPAEGTLRHFTESTRALPLARDLIKVRVAASGASYIITIENVAEARGLVLTSMSPIFWAVHDGSFQLFENATSQRAPGLEELAENGNARALVDSNQNTAGVLAAGVTEGRLEPEQSVSITVTPDPAHPSLTLASAIIEANDAFVASENGVLLLDSSGAAREPSAIEADLARMLGVWDAGTEANEVPGAGVNQIARQGGTSSGAADSDERVRRYADATNDFAGERAGGYVEVTVTHVSGTEFEVRLANTSGSTVNPGMLTRFVWVVHDTSFRLLDPSGSVSPGLEHLAEDCLTGKLFDEVGAAPGVLHAAVTPAPDGRTELGPLLLGDSFTIRVSPDAAHRFLSVVSMPFPTNDALVAFGPEGIALLDEAGRPRTNAQIAADIAASLRAWDAGTEANQSGSIGRDQSPHQAGYDMGASEGDGTVRRQADPVWSYPSARELVRVTIAPVP